MKRISLHVPALKETGIRAEWLSDPATMSYNAHQPYDAEDYDAETGCIAFPVSDWRYWRGVWLYHEPERLSAYICDEETGEFVGEACYYYDAEHEAYGTGVLVAAKYRGQGYGTAALKALAERAFTWSEIETLCVELPEEREEAVRMYMTCGFSPEAQRDGMCLLVRRKA